MRDTHEMHAQRIAVGMLSALRSACSTHAQRIALRMLSASRNARNWMRSACSPRARALRVIAPNARAERGEKRGPRVQTSLQVLCMHACISSRKNSA